MGHPTISGPVAAAGGDGVDSLRRGDGRQAVGLAPIGGSERVLRSRPNLVGGRVGHAAQRLGVRSGGRGPNAARAGRVPRGAAIGAALDVVGQPAAGGDGPRQRERGRGWPRRVDGGDGLRRRDGGDVAGRAPIGGSERVLRPRPDAVGGGVGDARSASRCTSWAVLDAAPRVQVAVHVAPSSALHSTS